MPLPELSRRTFLSGSLRAAGAASALPLLAPACSAAGRARAPAELRVFSAGEWEVLAAVADAFLPRGGAFALGAADVDLAARIDRFLAEGEPEIAEGVRGGLWLLEWGGAPLAGRLGRFSRLDAAGRAAVLAALPRRFGLARRLYSGLKQLCVFVFYASPESWAVLGYDGPWVGRPPGADA